LEYPLALTEKELKQRDEIVADLNNAYQQRVQTYTELDDMTYDEWYLSNKKASCGYIKPKTNKEDLRTVTGNTREKCNTVVTSLLRYNFDFTIEAFDENDYPDRSLGFGMEGLVRKSRKLEQPVYEEKRALFLNEFVSQGNVFLYEANVEEEVLRKKMEGREVEDVFKMKWVEKKEMERRCEVDMIPGFNVYLGDIREYFLEKQPFIGLRREITKAQTTALYGNWARFKYVEDRKQILLDLGGQEYNDWSMLTPQDGYDEEIRYFNVFTNTYQILVNGVPMLPEGFPLEYLLGVRKYPLVKVNGEPISRNFAYCRGISSKNKFNQAIIDELFKQIVLKFRKSTNPPMANLTGKQLNKSIFYPGTIHQGVDPEKLRQIGENNAVTGAEFNTFELVKRAIDESSVAPILEGQRTPGEQTAKEITELKTQSLIRLGMVMVGAIQMEEQLVWLRIYNILKNWTAPIDVHLEKVKGGIKKKEVYRSESVGRDFDDGTTGIQQIEMMGGEVPSEDRVFAEEEFLSKRKGVPIRKTYLNAKDLAELKYRFYVKVTPSEKDANELRSALFEESMMKALQLFPESINRPYVQEQWATYQKLDPQKLFIKNAPQLPPGMEGEGGIDKTVGAQMLPQVSQQTKPGVKMMM
jgi:hypothetical protein